MKDFAKIVKGVINPLIIFTKNSIMDDHKVLNTSMTQIRHEGNVKNKKKQTSFNYLSHTIAQFQSFKR